MTMELGPLKIAGGLAPFAGALVTGLPFNGTITQLYAEDRFGHGTHNGWDIAAPLYTRIMHWGPAGKVVRLDTNLNSANGYAVVVEAPAQPVPWWFFYLHMSEPGNDRGIPLEVGDEIERGQMVGRIGLTGRTTGPHTHLGVWQVGMDLTKIPSEFRSVHVDPALYVVDELTPEVVPPEVKANGPITVTQEELEMWVVLAEHNSFQHSLDSAWRADAWEFVTLRRPTDRGGSF